MPTAARRDAQARRAGASAPDLWQCPICHRMQHLDHNAIDNHLRHCPQLPGHASGSHETAAVQHHEWQAAARRSSLSSDSDSDTDTDSADGPDVGAHRRTDREVRGPHTLLGSTPIVPVATAGTGGDATQSSNNHSDDVPLLPPGVMYVVPHPHSGKQPFTTDSPFLFSAAREEIPRANLVPPGSPSLPVNVSPLEIIHPFVSMKDFQQAEAFINFGQSDGYINAQLKIEGRDGYKNAHELHSVLQSSLNYNEFGKWSEDTIAVPFPGEAEPRKYTVHWRSPKHAIEGLLEDPTVQPLLQFYPQRCYVRHFDGSARMMRVWREEWDGDDWWDYQTIIGPDGVVIFVQIYTDQTVLSTFGSKQTVWAVYLWIGNVPKAHRRGKGVGRAILIGILPSKTSKKGDNDEKKALHRVYVYHAAIRLILGHLRLDASLGFGFEVRDKEYWGHSLLSILSMDYEDMIKAALILGVQSGFPCPICLVPRDELYLKGTAWDPRTLLGTADLIHQAHHIKTKKGKKKKLLEQSIRDVENAFVEVMHPETSVYKIFGPDPLHCAESGLEGAHDWPWTIKFLDSAMAEVDSNFTALPPFPGVHHFSADVSLLKNLGGSEYNVIARYLVPCSQGLYPPAYEAQILRYKRLLGEYILLFNFDVHTDMTYELLDECLEELSKAAQVLSALNIGLDYSWPKMHIALNHTVPRLRAKGPANNYHTGLGEGLHPQMKKDFRVSNKQPGYEKQLLQKVQERNVIYSIRHRLDLEEEERHLAQLAPHHPPDRRVRLTSPQRPCTVDQMLDDLAQYVQRDTLERELVRFVAINVDQSLSKESLRGLRITPSFSVRIHYVSQETATYNEDIVHVHPNWRHSGPRRDWALVLAGQRHQAFAQLLYMFSFVWKNTFHSISFVRTHYRYKRSEVSRYIELTDKDGHCEFMLADSLIRHTHVLPPTRTRPQSVVQDLEKDLYLRLHHVK